MDTFTALSDPTRRGILALLGNSPHSAGEIASRFDISAPAISQHLKTLRRARLVTVRTDAQRRIYAIDPTGLREIDAWLNQYRSFWSNSLDRLEAELQKALKTEKSTKKKGKKK